MYRFLGILSCLIALSALNAREQQPALDANERSALDASEPRQRPEPQAAALACPTTRD